MAATQLNEWQAMMATVGLLALSAIIGTLMMFLMRVKADEDAKQPTQQQRQAAKAKAGPARRRRGALERMQQDMAEAEGDASDASDQEEAGGEAREQLQRERARAARAERRREQQEREAARQERDTYSAKQRERDEERLRREDEEQAAEREKERQEKAEFEKWKAMFEVQEQGEDEAAGGEEYVVEKFVDYIKMRKVVSLEELAAAFQMRAASAIDRIRALEQLDRLSGIFDDRGKYIYVSSEEMIEVAEWLSKKGRITRPELVAACNKIIRLDPTEQDKARLEREAKSAADALEDTEAAAG
eukprot:TRINITY_DN76777_c0_g1_i1.p1 TRINITY_DN76777_c0_g1~~TRINITY_DN76777_c0_g1_i1.p1  ORF type:complete len:302 (-),score=121.23 TRINITY_DN76777_c0_g1_i1:340-1245(-)